MPIDIRTQAAKYYDLLTVPFDDIPFYLERIPSPHAHILELGCGTGRVLVSLAKHCCYIHGIDVSKAMLAICQKKLADNALKRNKARVELADITDFNLERTFDLIIAPYRVFQNIEVDEQVNGLFKCLHKHLAPGGTCILNVFNPYGDPEALSREWPRLEEKVFDEKQLAGQRVVFYEKRLKIDREKMVLYFQTIIRRYEAAALVDEATMRFAMRCYWPDDFQRLITDHGFTIVNQWGGYAGQPYGQGPELIIQFTPK